MDSQRPVYIYNSLTRKKEPLKPVNPPQINIYTCGVTVYDQCHIGHARSLYSFEVIRRYLEYRYGQENINFVRNITDIDDKIINRANEIELDWKELVERYIASYNEDLDSLCIRRGILDAEGQEPRATKNIPDMIEHIKVLIDKGYAYQSGADVYFDVRRFSDYGKLSGQSIDRMREGSRIETSENKKDHLDFALWKGSKEGEPSWDSPWGKGRPGWHIECSVMSRKFLKTDTLDIHAGGRDLIFPHHENEIAQAEAFSGRPFARHWMHHGLLTIDGQKMSKSLGNFITIKDILSQYPPDAVKIFYLQAHYSSPIDFTHDRMQECRAALDRFYIFFDRVKSYKESISKLDKLPTLEFKEKIGLFRSNFIASMDDDFNTPRALGGLFDIIHETNLSISDAALDIAGADLATDTIKELGCIFGLSFDRTEKISSDIESRIEERNAARAEKNFKKSDRIRDELLGEGIILEDIKDGKTTWRRKV